MTTTRARIDDVTFYVIVCVIMTLTELLTPAFCINWL